MPLSSSAAATDECFAQWTADKGVYWFAPVSRATLTLSYLPEAHLI